jgi:hypothetical protein
MPKQGHPGIDRREDNMTRFTRSFVSALALLAAAHGARADEKVHVVKASSFADPADVVAFKKCRKSGKTEVQCFAVGDNGIGLWGDDTTVASPICALPRDVWLAKWKKQSIARGRKIELSFNKKTVICELRDTLPLTAKIKNGAGIDLNPGAASALGLKPPFMQPNVGWSWVD